MVNILINVKGIVGVSIDNDAFDEELLSHINSAAVRLSTLGVTEFDDLEIDESTEYPEFTNSLWERMSKTYVAQKVKSVFDPTSSATVREAYDTYTKELETLIVLTTIGEG